MSDKPIMFSGPMVRALLEGRKTQTRRILKPTRPQQVYNFDLSKCPAARISGEWVAFDHPKGGSYTCIPLRYGTGDRLWVREAWRLHGWATDVASIFYRASEGEGYTKMCEQFPVEGRCYIAPTPSKWKPGIHMPRWASRLTLIVTDARVQRLQDISEEDAIAEGAGLYVPGHGFITRTDIECDPGYSNFLSPRLGFQIIWTEINGEASWDANPWVAAISFTVHRCNIGAMMEAA